METAPVKDVDVKEEGHFWVDGHVDLTYFMMRRSEEKPLSAMEDAPFAPKKAREAGFRLFANALYCEDRYNGQGSVAHLDHILGFTLDHFDDVALLKGPGDLRDLRDDAGGVGALLLLENADALAGNLSHISRLKDAGVRIVGLTHAGRNRLADGNRVRYPEGLTREGRDVIRAVAESGMLMDVAHLHPTCFWQLLDLAAGPVISSHTGIQTLCRIPRNIDMDQAREIMARGGIVGLTFNPEMLSPDGKGDLDRIFAHLDTLVQAFGPEGVGIGSDFCGFDAPAEGMEDVGKAPGLVDCMREHGYGSDAVDKIMGGNWLRLYEEFLFPP
jgi:membrane dipeptidase